MVVGANSSPSNRTGEAEVEIALHVARTSRQQSSSRCWMPGRQAVLSSPARGGSYGLRSAMWLGVQLHHSWAVSADEPFTAMPAHRAGRFLSVTGDKRLIDSREVVPKVTDENIQFAEILIF